MCGAGLRVRCWGGCVVAGQAEQGAWIVLAGRCGCLRWVEQLGFWLAAVAVNRVVLTWELVRTNIFDHTRADWAQKDGSAQMVA